MDRLAAGGAGVGRKDGLVWLVEGAVPEDEVWALPVRKHTRYIEARAIEIVIPSPNRRAPPCPIQGRCGGCPWMVLDEREQRSWKRRILEDAFSRIGGLRDVRVEEPLASPLPLGYRNKVEFTFGRNAAGELVLGLHAAGFPHLLVDVERCLLQDESANRVLGLSRSFFFEGPGRGAPALEHPREPLRLVLRRSQLTGRILVALRGAPSPFPQAEEFARHLVERAPEVVSVVRLLARPGRRGGARTVPVLGPPCLEEKLGGTVFRLPAATFFQVNPGAAERLVEVVLDLSAPLASMRAIELYGGVGVFSLALARRGARATVCEADPDAVRCGRQAAEASGEPGATFVRSDAGAYLRRRLRSSKPRPDLVVADPPRGGLGRGVGGGIADLGPRRVVLVSCDPATLARDARALVGRGYAVRRAILVDLFPQTPHIETVVLLERGS